MNQECSSCHCYGKRCINYLLGGATFLLCEKCLDKMEKINNLDEKLEFVKKRPESKILDNIREARKRREKGEYLWN